MNTEENRRCTCPHHFIIPFLVFAVGIVLLLNNLGYLTADMTKIVWPAFIAIAGIQLMISRRCACHNTHSHCHHCHHCMHDGSAAK